MIPYVPHTVMITGATGGIGSALAQRFAHAGCQLILTSRSPERLRALQKTLADVKVYHCLLDLCDQSTLQKKLHNLLQRFTHLDVLINNAGLALGFEPAHQASLQDWYTMIDTNNKALVTCTRIILAAMVQRGQGHIINIGSTVGSYPYPYGNVYSASKAFVNLFSSTLRADLLGTGVRVTSIEPGKTKTNFSFVRFKGDHKRAEKVYANSIPLSAEDVAEATFWTATLPLHININCLEMMPTAQAFGPFRFHEIE